MRSKRKVSQWTYVITERALHIPSGRNLEAVFYYLHTQATVVQTCKADEGQFYVQVWCLARNWILHPQAF